VNEVSALGGVRVLDLTRLLPGPFCTMLLADMGADVVKLEEVRGGDPARQYPPSVGDTGSLFLLVNRNKRSLTLDLKTTEGRDLLLRLVGRFDVLVEGFRPGVMERLGIGYEVLSRENPRLIYASLSGFGQTGPYRDRAAHDLNYIALAGILGYNVDADGTPFPLAAQVADLGGGTLAALAILAAIISRQTIGRGQVVDVSLFASAFAWLPTLAASVFATGRSLAPGAPPLSGGLPQYNVYRTADGRFLSLGALEPKFLVAFCERVGRPDVPLMDVGGMRAELRAVVAGRTLAEWLDCLADVDTCYAPVNTLEEAFADPQVAALGLLKEVEHARLGTLRQIGPPFAFSETPAEVRRPPPELGEHTHEVLTELDLTSDDIAALRARGVV
jgi:crotonobetainyl-CoA:carnitine CoA-transferase CaiB-like acyl-CoA transferase